MSKQKQYTMYVIAGQFTGDVVTTPNFIEPQEATAREIYEYLKDLVTHGWDMNFDQLQILLDEGVNAICIDWDAGSDGRDRVELRKMKVAPRWIGSTPAQELLQ